MTADTTTEQAIGYAAGSITKVPDWHGLVAWDMLFNNLSTGLFLTAALGELTAPTIFSPLAKTAYPFALVFLLVDLLCLVLDLGDPLRFHHMLRVFKPTSPMSLGTWCLTIYSFPLAVAAASSLLPAPETHSARLAVEWIRTAAVVLAILPALGSACYKGVLLSTNAQPGWRDARWLGGYLANSALMLGCAEMLVLAVLIGNEKATTVFRFALGLLLLLNALILLLLLADLRPVLSRRYSPRRLCCIGMATLGGGTLLPLCLLAAGSSPPWWLAAVMLLLLGSLGIRFVIVKIPHGKK
ncbi:MAG: NrfD/PsrC family molybdoenzyme membrane anchor subunit [Gemmataceae bacterium]